MTTATPNAQPKTDLSLSAGPGLRPEDAHAAAYIERELDQVDQWRRHGYVAVAEARLDRLFDFILDQPSESELRILDGNR